METITSIREAIINDSDNLKYTQKGLAPVFMASIETRILIIGQAPGFEAQEKQEVFKDKSGAKLRSWLGVSEDVFYHSGLISVMPMDFYYPGADKVGDLPPRETFAPKWHSRIIALMPKIELIVLVGRYAQDYYLKDQAKDNLTKTVKAYQEYLPKFFPIVHPSPLNYRWLVKNPEFEKDIVPELKKQVKKILESN